MISKNHSLSFLSFPLNHAILKHYAFHDDVYAYDDVISHDLQVFEFINLGVLLPLDS